MTARPRRPSPPTAVIAAEVRAACDALRRALAAGKEVRDDTSLEILLDDLAVVAGDLALIDRDLSEMGR